MTLKPITMLFAVGLALPAVAMAQTRTEREFDVDAGGHLDLHNIEGSIEIKTWDQNRVHLVATHDRDISLEIDAGRRSITIHPDFHRNGHRAVDFKLSVPRKMDIEVHSVGGDIAIGETEGRVEAHSVRGRIDVKGGRGVIELHSVQGPVTVDGANGDIEVGSVNQTVTVTNASGDIEVTVVNGKIELLDVDSDWVEASSVNGSISYRGSVKSNGRYEFSSHNGGIRLDLPANAGARVEATTFQGSLETSFPVTISEVREGKEFEFTLGSGGARIEMHTFNGSMEIRRAGE